jgi:hypothetical protein
LDKEYFWSLDNHLVIKDLGYTPPKSEVHTLRHEHEKGLGDLFVSLILADMVVTWTMHKRLGKDFIPDRTLESEVGIVYIEYETGSQNLSVWREKIQNYLNYYRDKKEQFRLLFTMADEDAVRSIVKLFEEMNCSSHYYAGVHSELVADPINALVTSRFSTKKLSILLSIT